MREAGVERAGKKGATADVELELIGGNGIAGEEVAVDADSHGG
jgi:hypothetical protein